MEAEAGFTIEHSQADARPRAEIAPDLAMCAQCFGEINDSELAGACFSPSGDTLFFNIFGRARFDEPANEGMTCAVTGPWHRGPL